MNKYSFVEMFKGRSMAWWKPIAVSAFCLKMSFSDMLECTQFPSLGAVRYGSCAFFHLSFFHFSLTFIEWFNLHNLRLRHLSSLYVVAWILLHVRYKHLDIFCRNGSVLFIMNRNALEIGLCHLHFTLEIRNNFGRPTRKKTQVLFNLNHSKYAWRVAAFVLTPGTVYATNCCQSFVDVLGF